MFLKWLSKSDETVPYVTYLSADNCHGTWELARQWVRWNFSQTYLTSRTERMESSLKRAKRRQAWNWWQACSVQRSRIHRQALVSYNSSMTGVSHHTTLSLSERTCELRTSMCLPSLSVPYICRILFLIYHAIVAGVGARHLRQVPRLKDRCWIVGV